jgi:toxin-antitoxin system PIN domain toxin
MTAFLLDVNILVALAWPGHIFHEQAESWFARRGAKAWATCPFTETAFVRILANPSFSASAVRPQEAIRALSISVKHPGHRFWPAEIGAVDALHSFQDRLVGHQQVTDAYLLALAMKKGGKLATLDRSVLALLPSGSPEVSRIEVIS